LSTAKANSTEKKKIFLRALAVDQRLQQIERVRCARDPKILVMGRWDQA
jgi:hypothetical protein